MNIGQQDGEAILIVEDDANIGSVLLKLLEYELPYPGVLATDSLIALDIVLKIKPVLFILNYRLPHINGIDLYDRLHSISGLEKVPALMLSANLPQEELKQRGIVGIEKPFDIDSLLDRIEALIKTAKRENFQ